ncbi:nonribosomal peptide synthase sidE-like [Quercus suber]|uniref:nonribosomal peptide synthase sidE-like n=1 Tax=Quercus suber TaxID=58331 RepID=UPI0032DF01B0
MWVCMVTRSLDVDAYLWVRSARELTKANAILRTTFTRFDQSRYQAYSGWLGVVLKRSSPRSFEDPDIVRLDGKTSRQQALDRIWNQGFEFGRPFICYTILQHTDGKLEMVIKMDHGLYDGSLLRIWQSHFSAFHSGQAIAKFTDFRDFAFWTQNMNKTKTKEFWRSQLADSRVEVFAMPSKTYLPCAAQTIFMEGKTGNDILTAAASKANVTVPILFQAAFQLWLANQCNPGRKSQENKSGLGPVVSFDYLYTGRNIDLPQPDTINGPCATFVPLFIRLGKYTQPLSDYLSSTQSSFWEATENASLSIRDIYSSADLDRQSDGNKILFLYQPFEAPAPQEQLRSTIPFITMAGSQVRMRQPYAMVCQVKRTSSKHLVQFTFDENVLSREDIWKRLEDIWKIIGRLCDNLLEEKITIVQDLLGL